MAASQKQQPSVVDHDAAGVKRERAENAADGDLQSVQALLRGSTIDGEDVSPAIGFFDLRLDDRPCRLVDVDQLRYLSHGIQVWRSATSRAADLESLGPGGAPDGHKMSQALRRVSPTLPSQSNWLYRRKGSHGTVPMVRRRDDNGRVLRDQGAPSRR